MLTTKGTAAPTLRAAGNESRDDEIATSCDRWVACAHEGFLARSLGAKARDSTGTRCECPRFGLATYLNLHENTEYGAARRMQSAYGRLASPMLRLWLCFRRP
jgi:hypothetical protein